jgi:hypothetical protein
MMLIETKCIKCKPVVQHVSAFELQKNYAVKRFIMYLGLSF